MISKPYCNDFRLDGKVAVITGAASGIGYATAELFAQRGAAVCLLDVNPEQVRQAAGRIEGSRAFCVDICNKNSVDCAIDAISVSYTHLTLPTIA